MSTRCTQLCSKTIIYFPFFFFQQSSVHVCVYACCWCIKPSSAIHCENTLQLLEKKKEIIGNVRSSSLIYEQCKNLSPQNLNGSLISLFFYRIRTYTHRETVLLQYMFVHRHILLLQSTRIKHGKEDEMHCYGIK